MLRHHLVFSLRDIGRRRLSAAVTIAGLAVGIAASVLIFLWVLGEFSWDRFHEDGSRIYRVIAEDLREGKAERYWQTSLPLAPALRDLPGIEETTAFRPLTLVTVRAGEVTAFERRFVFADEGFLRFFGFPLLRGDPATVLSRHDAVVLSASTARRYFGDRDPVGRRIEATGGRFFTVTGVAADPPANSSVRFDLLVRLENLPPFYPFMEVAMDGWDVHSVMTFARLESGADPSAVDASIRRFLRGRATGYAAELHLQPLRNIHLRSYGLGGPALPWRGDIRFVLLFAGIGLFVLLLACVNAVNISTARAAERLRAIALRKAAGADGRDILRLLATETAVAALIAGALAAVAVELVLPRFGEIAGAGTVLAGAAAWLVLPAVTLAAAIVVAAGVLPAVALAGASPAAVLHGRTVAGRSGARLRSVLVVLQFAIAVSLIAATGTVMRQIDFILGSDPGFDTDRLQTTPIDAVTAARFDEVRRRLLAEPAVEAVAAASNDPLIMSHFTTGAFLLEGRTEPVDVLVSYLSASPGFLDLIGVPILAGSIYGADTAQAVVNAEGARLLELERPVGTGFELFWPARIVGVCGDFHFESFRRRIRPLFLMPVPKHYKHLYVRLAPVPDAADRLRAAWRKAAPGAPLELRPAAGILGDRYTGERRLARLFAWFAGLAVFLSCLGLFGLAAHEAERRTVEIAIRKAVGASRPRIVLMLSAEYARLVLVASLVAWPVSWLLMRRWLGGFAYRTGPEPAVFAGASLIALLVAVLSVSIQALRAASIEPARALRDE